MRPGADWAAWLPGTCQVGRLVRPPGGPLRQKLEVGQTTYPVNREGYSDGGERREWGTKSQKGGKGVERGRGQVPLARDRRLYLDVCAAPSPRVPSYATADGAGLPT